MSTPAISLKEANVGFQGTQILNKLSLTVQQGEWLSLLGPNGCGKTTLLRTLVGSLPLLSGHRECALHPLGFVPQRFTFPPDNPVTVEELFQTKNTSRPLNSHQQELLEAFAIRPFYYQSIRVLSRGEIQRALLAFALWDKPKLLFLDEYLEGLDPRGQSTITGYLESMHRESGLTVIEVSHDISSVVHVATRVIILQKEILFDGKPQDRGFDECLHSVYGHHHWIKHHD